MIKNTCVILQNLFLQQVVLCQALSSLLTAKEGGLQGCHKRVEEEPIHGCRTHDSDSGVEGLLLHVRVKEGICSKIN